MGTIGFDAVALSFQLPSEDHDSELTGVICSRHTDHDETYVGIQFDEQQSPKFKEQQREITRYLMNRQRKLIRNQ